MALLVRTDSGSLYRLSRSEGTVQRLEVGAESAELRGDGEVLSLIQELRTVVGFAAVWIIDLGVPGGTVRRTSRVVELEDEDE